MSKLALQLIQEAKRTKSKILDLGNCGLTELPDELFELVWLEELYLSNGWKYDLGSKTEIKFNTQSKGNVNKISYLPPTISSLKELKILVIHGYKPTSVKDLRPLNSLVNLEQIDIKGNSVKNLTPLKGLKKLHFLNIAGTLVSSLNPLRGLKKLHFLNIAETRVRDLSSLNNLIKIETLGVGGCKIKNIKACENKINLRRLYLWKTQITDLNDLKKLNNLRELIIHNTKISDLSPLQDLYNLQELSASQTQVRDLSPLQNLSNLQRLFVHQTQVSDLRPLKKMIEKGIAVKWESYFSDEKKIIVKDCPLTNPPIEIVKQGNKAILNYWKQIEEQGGTEIINEAKLIIRLVCK